MSTDIHQNAGAWLVRRQRGLSEAEEAAFQRWRDEPGHAQAYEDALRAWHAFGDGSAPELQSLRLRAARLRTTRRHSVLSRLAATLLVLILLAGSIGVFSLPRADRHEAGPGLIADVRLEDGSLAVLDQGAVLLARYSRQARELELENGQARFIVQADPQRPFRVTVGEHRVVAVGTVFNIDRTGDRVVVTLVEGLVDIEAKSRWPRLGQSPAPVRLTAGQQAVLSGGEMSVSQVETQTASIWRSELAFTDVGLNEAVTRVNRYADIPVSLETSDLSSLRISGAFNHGDSRGFARGVGNLYGLDVVEREDQIVIRRRRER